MMSRLFPRAWRRRFVAENFTRERVRLDGRAYVDCSFRGCTMLYCGAGGVTMEGCDLIDCSFVFDGPAGSTVKVLRALSGDPAFRPIFEALVGIR